MQDKLLEKEINLRKLMIESAGQRAKYDRQGIYAIFVQDKLVYIGKSENMFHRVASHMLAIDGIGKDSKGRKYQLLRQAKKNGYNIRFDVLEYIEGNKDDLGKAEAIHINRYIPVLNLQIPSLDDYRRNRQNPIAKNITYKNFEQLLVKAG